jgi:hypothetical protein
MPRDAIWRDWTTTATSATASANRIWTAWHSTTASVTPWYDISTAQYHIWQTWTTNATTTSTLITIDQDGIWTGWHPRAPIPHAIHTPTPEEVAALEQQRQEAHARWEAEQTARQEAEVRAEALLLAHLTDQQRTDYLEKGYFDMPGERGRHTYRLWKGSAGNVKRLNARGTEVMSYCIHPREHLPHSDVVLAQKLLLETAEAEFLRLANARPVH